LEDVISPVSLAQWGKEEQFFTEVSLKSYSSVFLRILGMHGKVWSKMSLF